MFLLFLQYCMCYTWMILTLHSIGCSSRRPTTILQAWKTLEFLLRQTSVDSNARIWATPGTSFFEKECSQDQQSMGTGKASATPRRICCANLKFYLTLLRDKAEGKHKLTSTSCSWDAHNTDSPKAYCTRGPSLSNWNPRGWIRTTQPFNNYAST